MLLSLNELKHSPSSKPFNGGMSNVPFNAGIVGYQYPASFYDHNMTAATYRKTSNISRTLVGNKIVDNSDVVRALPVGAAPTTSSFST